MACVRSAPSSQTAPLASSVTIRPIANTTFSACEWNTPDTALYASTNPLTLDRPVFGITRTMPMIRAP